MDADSFLPADVGLALHARLLAPDSVAASELCREFVPPIVAHLARRFPHLSTHHHYTAAHDAVMSYLKEPLDFDPGQLDLGRYLLMAAHADLLNLLAWERRRPLNPLPDVEDTARAGNPLTGDPVGQLLAREQSEKACAYIRRVRAGLDPADQRVLDLMLGGERRTAVYADALGFAGRPPEAQEPLVKRAKDRVRKRLERGGWPDDGSGASDGRAGAA
jgi:hypothetical protein